MRKLIFSVLTLVVLLPNAVSSINYRDKAITLISFNVSISSETRKVFEKYDSQFPSAVNENADKFIARIKDLAWSSFVDTIQQKVGMVILPISTLGSTINYDAYGFPDVNITKAQKKGTSKFFMKVDIQISPETYQGLMMLKKDKNIQHIKLKDGEIRPMVSITLTTFSNNGIVPIGKYEGFSVAPNPWSLDDSSIFDGLVNENNKYDLSTFMSLINEAINDLSKNIHS